MLPVLQIGPVAIQTYPLALVLAGWIALEVGARVARRTGLDGDHVYNAGLYGLLAGVLGARLGHVVAYWPAYRSQPLEVFGFNTHAFLLWPGILGAMAVVSWYLYRRRLPAATMLDALAPGLAAGVGIAQVGALLAGRNPGAPTNLPWAVNLWGVARHPSQVYEALAVLLVLTVVGIALRRRAAAGTAAWLALLGYGLSLWLLEPFRAESVTVLGGLRAPQLWGLVAALVALRGLRHLAMPRKSSADGASVAPASPERPATSPGS